MAHSLSAAKRHRQSLTRRERNKGTVTAAKSAVRRAREAIVAGSDAEAAVRSAGAVLDRAARKGVIHPNNAARRKSRLARALKRGAPAVSTARRGGKARSS